MNLWVFVRGGSACISIPITNRTKENEKGRYRGTSK